MRGRRSRRLGHAGATPTTAFHRAARCCGATGPSREAISSRSWRLGSQAPRLVAGSAGLLADAWRSCAAVGRHEFTEAWERGEAPAVEDYLRRLDPADCQGAVDLIYREYCLAEADGQDPRSGLVHRPLPPHAEALRAAAGGLARRVLDRLLLAPARARRWGGLAGERGRACRRPATRSGRTCSAASWGGRASPACSSPSRANLENRLVVVKVATRTTREPWLLARVRHAHIVEIVSHAMVDDGAFQLICMPFWGGATLAAVLAARPSGAPAAGERASAGRTRHATCDRPTSDASPCAGVSVGPPGAAGSRDPGRLSYDRAIAWVDRPAGRGPRPCLQPGRGPRRRQAVEHPAVRRRQPDAARLQPGPRRSPAGTSGSGHDPGGTLAYMAPERLRALAAGGRPGTFSWRPIDGRPRAGFERIWASGCEPEIRPKRIGGPPGRHLLAGHGLAGSGDRPPGRAGGMPGSTRRDPRDRACSRP